MNIGMILCGLLLGIAVYACGCACGKADGTYEQKRDDLKKFDRWLLDNPGINFHEKHREALEDLRKRLRDD